MESISRIDRRRGPHLYLWAVVSAGSLIAAGALAAGWLAGYVPFDGGSVGTSPQQGGRLVVKTQERTGSVTVAEAPIPGAEDRRIIGAADSVASDGPGGHPGGDAGSDGDTAAPGAGTNGGPGQDEAEPQPQTGEPPAAVEPTAPTTPTATQPADVRPLEEPVAIPPVPAPEPVPASGPSGPLSAVTTELDDGLGSLGVDLPVTELTAPVTESADELLGLLGGRPD